MRAKMLSMALLAAALMSASMSASAQGRRGKFEKCRKAEFRKEIKFCKCDCPRCREFRRMQAFKQLEMRDPRFSQMQFREVRFKDARFEKGKHHKHSKKFHRR